MKSDLSLASQHTVATPTLTAPVCPAYRSLCVCALAGLALFPPSAFPWIGWPCIHCIHCIHCMPAFWISPSFSHSLRSLSSSLLPLPCSLSLSLWHGLLSNDDPSLHSHSRARHVPWTAYYRFVCVSLATLWASDSEHNQTMMMIMLSCFSSAAINILASVAGRCYSTIPCTPLAVCMSHGNCSTTLHVATGD